jgi:hypothetical protein
VYLKARKKVYLNARKKSHKNSLHVGRREGGRKDQRTSEEERPQGAEDAGVRFVEVTVIRDLITVEFLEFLIPRPGQVLLLLLRMTLTNRHCTKIRLDEEPEKKWREPTR